MSVERTQLFTLDLGRLKFPSDPTQGAATLKIGAEYKVDVQKPSGKDDPQIKGQGKDARRVKVSLWWTTRIDDEARAFLREISPVGVNAGKAWEISHPDMEIYNFASIEFTRIGEMDHEHARSSVELEALSWKKTTPAQRGSGTKTATEAEQWQEGAGTSDHIFFKTSDGNRIDMGPGPATEITSEGNRVGFNSADAPKAKVPR